MTDTPLSDDVVERARRAMQNAVIRDAEGEFPRLFDLLGFSGENKAVTVSRALARAALEAARYGETVEALRGLMAEFEKFSRYGSPIAKQANEAMQQARRALLSSIGASHDSH